MPDILMRAGCYAAIIILGYILRRKNFFPEETELPRFVRTVQKSIDEQDCACYNTSN